MANNKFKFRSYDIELDIEGRIFYVKPTKELSEKLVEFRDMINEFLQKALKGEAGIDDILPACKPVIDGILGEGASGEIFADRNPTPFDCADLVTYIAAEITEYYNGIPATGNLRLLD